MPVIPYRKTDLADADTGWNGDAERKAAEIEDLRVMCAWYLEPGDTKDDYKLPHHRAVDHACVLAGVQSALRLLNATDMPDEDRPAVRAHLLHHLRDFGVDDEDGEQQRQVALLQGDVASKAAGYRRYEVVAITAGDGNGLYYSESVLRGACPLFEGVSVFVDHAQLAEVWSQTGGRSLRNVLGVLEHVYFSEVHRGICGELRIYPGPDADWFCAMVDEHLADKAAGRSTPRLGLSAVVDVQTKGKEVVSIGRVMSVDAVFDPARGGEFLRAMNQGKGEDERMEEEAEYTLLEGHGMPYPNKPCPNEPYPNMRSPNEPYPNEPASGAQVLPNYGGGAAASQKPADGLGSGADTAVAQVWDMVLDMRLANSGLPPAMQTLVRQALGGHPSQVGKIEEAIEAVKSAWASSVAQAGAQVKGLGRTRVEVGINELDRLQAAMDRLCGLKPSSEALQGIRPVSGIRELYLMVTGDYEFRGVFDPERVALANVTTSTMTSLVKNAFNKVILDYFNTVDRWWEPIVSEEYFDSMKDVTLVTLGGFADLPTVAEGNAYTELSWSDEEEVVSFVKKGAYVGVTLEMMDKDETRAFRAIPRKLAVAGYRALSGMVANLWTANSGVGPYWPSGQSTYRLFCTNYGNLGTSALSASAWDAVIQAMYKQAEATSNERMGIRPAYLVVPIELEKTALTIMQSEGEPGTADNDANVRRGSSRVIVCPEMTDANDWLAVADPRVWPAIVVGYRFGNVPEVFIADQETVGSMFTNDEMRIKARFIVAVGVADYRPLYKSNVA
ncbi:MAG: phage major capsid protein [Anaerolineae bacterium]